MLQIKKKNDFNNKFFEINFLKTFLCSSAQKIKKIFYFTLNDFSQAV
jgi:hypothetical protein